MEVVIATLDIVGGFAKRVARGKTVSKRGVIISAMDILDIILSADRQSNAWLLEDLSQVDRKRFGP